MPCPRQVLSACQPLVRSVRDEARGLDHPRPAVAFRVHLLQEAIPAQPGAGAQACGVHVRLLQAHFPLVELKRAAPAQPRPIYLWCRSNLLEDPAFVEMKETILADAGKQDAHPRSG